jgi:transposase
LEDFELKFCGGSKPRLWAWLQNFRRVATRFDFHVENFLEFVHLGCIKILLRCYL